VVSAFALGVSKRPGGRVHLSTLAVCVASVVGRVLPATVGRPVHFDYPDWVGFVLISHGGVDQRDVLDVLRRR
jgi:putative effector of murein hydrolase